MGTVIDMNSRRCDHCGKRTGHNCRDELQASHCPEMGSGGPQSAPKAPPTAKAGGGGLVPFKKNVGRIFLDLDGVLADFDKRAEAMLKTTNIYKYEFVYGADAFWEGLNQDPKFFANLPLKADALELWFAVKPYNPIILTALPHTGAERVDQQKRAWCKTYFGGVPVITCLTREKPNFCQPGDVLVDDRNINREKWEARGGRFLLHQNATATNVALNHYGYI